MTTLITADFESGADGDSITTTNTGSTTISGTVTDVEIDTSWSLIGTRSFYINNVAVSGYANWTLSSHNLQDVRLYCKFGTAPGADAYFIEVRNGADNAIAYQVGVNSSNQIFYRDGTTKRDTSTVSHSSGDIVRIDIEADGAANFTLREYTGANLHSSNTANAAETVTGALAATNFSKFRLGCIASVGTGDLEMWFDYMEVNDAAIPAPLTSGTVAVTEADNTSAVTATETMTGTVAVTQAANTPSVTASETFTGTSATTQAANTSTVAATETMTGTVAVTQAAQTSTASGTETITGTSSTTQAAQTSDATGTETITGTVAVTQDAQTPSAAGTLTITGTSATTQAANTADATGTATTPTSGTVAVTQAANIGRASGTVARLIAAANPDVVPIRTLTTVVIDTDTRTHIRTRTP